MSSRKEYNVVLNVLRPFSKVKALPFQILNGSFVKNHSKLRVAIAWISVFIHLINGLYFLLKARYQLLSSETSRALLSAFLSVSSASAFLLIFSLENAVPECFQLANELVIFDLKFIKIRRREIKFSEWGRRLFTLFIYSFYGSSISLGLQCIVFSMDSWNERRLTLIYSLAMLIIFGNGRSPYRGSNVNIYFLHSNHYFLAQDGLVSS